MPTVCLNGRFMPREQAQITVEDRGFLYGYGLFETILIKEGRPAFWTLHLERLLAGCAVLGLTPPVSEDKLGVLIQETIHRNRMSTGALRLTLSAGAAGGESTLLLGTRPLPYSAGDYRRGFRACFADARRNEKSPLVRLKSLNYLENLLARESARRRGLDEALFLNTSGYLAEGSASNLFMVKNGYLITPDVEQGLLPGVVRRVVLEISRGLGLAVEERAVRPEELAAAEECFLTSSLLGVMPLVEVAGRRIGSGRPGFWTEKLGAALREYEEIE